MDIRELKVLIGRNQVRKVLKIVLQSECWKGDEALFDEWVRLSQRYHELKSLDKNAGWDPSELDRRRSIVVEALIKFLNKLPEDTQFTKAGPTWGRQAQTWTVGMSWEGLNYQYVENLKKQTSDLLKISPDQIRITGIREGSLVFQAVLPGAAAFEFRRIFKRGIRSTFFKQLKIEAIQNRFPSLTSRIYFAGYWLRYAINYNRIAVVMVSLMILLGITYSAWSRLQSANSLPAQRLISLNDSYKKGSADLLDIVIQAIELTENGNKELKHIGQTDSLGLDVSYTTLRLIVEQIGKKTVELEKKVKTMNEIVADFELVTEENIRITPKTNQNIARIEQIRRDQKALEAQLQAINTKVTLLKGSTGMLLLAIQLIENKNGDEELEALKAASIIASGNFEKIGDLKMF